MSTVKRLEGVLNTLDGFDLLCIGDVCGVALSRAGRGAGSLYDLFFTLIFLGVVWLIQSEKFERNHK